MAAGNDNTDACTVSPARLADAITVGATDSADNRSTFSNHGSCLDIFAPGTAIKSTYNTSDTATTTMSGTSMATPHVTGAAALILATNPTATPAQVRDALLTKAATGKITNVATGSPNKLLQVAATTVTNPTPTPAPPAATACAPVTNGTNVAVNDLSTASSSITVANCAGTASATAKVAVAIKHTYRGDLAIDLIAPDGTVYKLKGANDKDSVADVNATYTVNASTENRNGVWKLRVKDSYAGDTGYVDGWTLTV